MTNKRFDVVINSPHGDIIVHSGFFDPSSAKRYVVKISPRYGNSSLVYRMVKESLFIYNDLWLNTIESLPQKVKREFYKHIDLELLKAEQQLHKIMKTAKGEVEL